MTDSEFMDNTDTTHIGDTINIRRPVRVTTDDVGGTVWIGEVEPCALQLAASEHDSSNVFHWRTPVLRQLTPFEQRNPAVAT